MASGIRSQPPIRCPSGSTTAFLWGPLADSGYSDPSFYHQFYDDFDNALGPSGLWTTSVNNGGTVAHTPGDGGLALFTTGAVSTNFASIQLPAASFTLPQGSTIGKKLFFLTRVQFSDVTATAGILGLVNTTATIFTGGQITDGVYFTKTSGAATLNIVTVSASTAVTWTIPTSAYTLANNVNIDLGFYVDYYQNLNVFVGSQLFGFLPQSGTGGVSSTTGVSSLPVVGRVLQITGPSWQLSPASPSGAPWTVSTANLNPTLALQTEAASSKTMTVDFVGVQKER